MTSPQAFDGLRRGGRKVRRTDLTIATEDHNTPTDNLFTIADPTSRKQIETLRDNCEEFGVRIHSLGDDNQGVVHVVGPQLGLTQPGMTVVCGDSHTSTHGAFGSIAFGIGTSEVEHVLATQTLPQAKPKYMAVTVNGSLPEGVSAKDLILKIISITGTGGGKGHIVEYRGQAIEELSMEGRMTVCNMSIEWGAKAGMIAPDAKTAEYVKGRAHAPQGEDWDAAVAYWQTLTTDEGAVFDKEIVIDAASLSPFVTWGTNPGQGVELSGNVPHPSRVRRPDRAHHRRRTPWSTWASRPARRCARSTSTWSSSARAPTAASRTCAPPQTSSRAARSPSHVNMMVVPGSAKVREQAIAEGLDKVFIDAGADWRFAGCSMCLGMNPDQLTPGQRAASTSNRNFEGRQGKGGRTHLVSPAVAAATAVTGHLASPADL